MCGKDLSMIGLRLLTIDGKQYSNAIVYDISGNHYLIESDFGNRFKKHRTELHLYWKWDLDEPRDLERWYRERDLLRCRNMGSKACSDWEAQKEIIANFVRDK